VVGCCECNDEPSGSCTTELVSYDKPRRKAEEEVVMIHFKVLFQHLSRRDEKNHNNPQSGELIPQLCILT
jgi:hypothetical protein